MSRRILLSLLALPIGLIVAGCNPPVINAIHHRDPAAVQGDLSSGASPNTSDRLGRPALWLAAYYGEADVVKTLLRNGAFPNVYDPGHRYTPLMLAAKKGRPDIVEELLEAHAGPDLQNCNGATALHFAASAGHADVVRILIEHGANVNIRDDNGMTPAEMTTTAEVLSELRHGR
jgi:ankyrin repeat protein